MHIKPKFHWGQLGPTLVVVLAIAGQYALQDVVGLRPFQFLFPAIVAGALIWGRLVPGIVATCIATFALHGFFPPRLLGALEQSGQPMLLALFFLFGLVLNYLSVQLRRSQTRVRKLQARVNRLIDSNIVGIVSWNIEGKITEANDVFLQMLGYSRDDLEYGRIDWRRLSPPEWSMVDEQGFTELYAHGAHRPIEKELLRKDGSRVPIIVGAALYQDTSSEGVSFILDITEQKSIREDLAHALRIRDDFISIASHELKTPLTSLMLQSDLLMRKLARADGTAFDPAQVQRAAELTRKQLGRLSRLVDDLLDVSRIQTGHLSLHRDAVDLSALVQETAERLAPAAAAAGAALCLEVPPDPVVGQWDAFRIEQVVTNLLTNAIRYGGAKPIGVSVVVSGETVHFRVADSGAGVSCEDQERIFHRFERASTSKANSGLGLGLFIARVIVELHDGRIWVESAGRGHGATFYVELPLAPLKAPRAELMPV